MNLVLKCAGKRVSKEPAFISIIQKNLIPNSIFLLELNSNSVFKALLEVYLTLVLRFRHQIKGHLFVLLNDVLLKILESNTLGLATKTAILSFLAKILGDSDAVIDFYANYDSDYFFEPLLSRVIELISKDRCLVSRVTI